MSQKPLQEDLSDELVPLLAKELKSVKERIKYLENELAQRHTPTSESQSWGESQLKDYKDRAEAAEEAMEVWRQNFEQSRAKIIELQAKIDEMEQKKIGFKEEPLETGLTSSTSGASNGVVNKPVQPTADLTPREVNRIHKLETDIKQYYINYKTERDRRKGLENTSSILQEELDALKTTSEESTVAFKGQIDSLTIRNDQLQEELRKESDMTLYMRVALQEENARMEEMKEKHRIPSTADLFDLMSSLPHCHVRPNAKYLVPICLEGTNLQEYLALDADTIQYATNFLYLPGLSTMQGSEFQHALAVTPTHCHTHSNWKKCTTLSDRIGQTISFFFQHRGFIYYSGEYVVSDLSPNGGMKATSFTPFGTDITMGTLTDATLPDDDEKGRAYTLVKQLLASAVFKVSPFSLH